MSRKRVKQYLTLLMAIGVIAVVAGGSGTFASFQAETTNSGNTFATGTLFLHNTSGSTTCTSESASDNLAPTGCATLFTVAALGPNDTGHADLTLTNAGTVNSSQIQFDTPDLGSGSGCTEAAPSIATLSGPVTLNGSVSGSSIPITASSLTQDLTANTPITVTDLSAPSNTEQFTVASDTLTSSSPTSIPVKASPSTWNYAYSNTSPITIKTSFGTPTLCSDIKVYVQEYTSGFASATSTCAYPASSIASCSTGNAISSIGTALQALTLDTSMTGLPAGKSRYFRIVWTAPSSLTNTDQNDQAKFNLKWHLEH